MNAIAEILARDSQQCAGCPWREQLGCEIAKRSFELDSNLTGQPRPGLHRDQAIELEGDLVFLNDLNRGVRNCHTDRPDANPNPDCYIANERAKSPTLQELIPPVRLPLRERAVRFIVQVLDSYGLASQG